LRSTSPVASFKLDKWVRAPLARDPQEEHMLCTRIGAALGAAAFACCAAHAARAQVDTSTGVLAPSDSNWSATAARTTGSGSNVLQAEVGWPGIDFTFLHGLDERSDLGARVNFLYGFEGTTSSVAGLQFQVPYRRVLTNGETTNVGFHFDPGLTIYGDHAGYGTLVGIGGPIGAVIGFRIDPRLTLDAGADFPVLISFTNPAGVLFGPQLGGGAEYAVDRSLLVTFRARFGPEFAVASGQPGSQFAFSSMVGLAYNTR
jgi:hypothetical protein